MKVVDFLRPELVIAELKSSAKPDILAEMATHLGKNQPGVDPQTLRRVLEERADEMPAMACPPCSALMRFKFVTM